MKIQAKFESRHGRIHLSRWSSSFSLLAGRAWDASLPASRFCGGGRMIAAQEQRVNVRSQRAFLQVDLAIALVILTLAIIPLGFAFPQQQKAFRVDYCRAVANEIVDGEMEILAAGDWKSFPDGRQTYIVHCRAAANLPPGHFELIKKGNHLRLEWQRNGAHNPAVVREITVQ